MQHFYSESFTLGDLLTAYPHSPEDRAATFQDYLEDKLSQGYDFIGTSGYYGGTGPAQFFFKVVAK